MKLLFHCEPKMSNDKEITYLLGMQILCDHVLGWLCTCLKKKLLSSFTLLTMCMCHPINIPLEASLKLSQEDSPLTPNDNTYGLDFLFTTCWDYSACYCVYSTILLLHCM
jgi:hypothetical protein